MLQITINGGEVFDESTQEFHEFKTSTITLEHSLVSISKWESKWKKPFLSNTEDRTSEELLDYIRCMTITQNVDPYLYYNISVNDLNRIRDYIQDSMTATTFHDYGTQKKTSKKQVITSELIYYWMIALNIPWECQKWHLNRLLTLIRVCEIKTSPPKKMSRSEAASMRSKLNAERRAAMNSKG